MAAPLAFLRFVAKATLNALSGGVAGDFAVEVLPDIARGVWKRCGKNQSPEQLRKDLEAIANLPPDEAAQLARRVAAEEAAGHSEAILLTLESYLTQVPAAIRQSQSCAGGPADPADPAGPNSRNSLNISLCLRRPEDLIPLLPSRIPHFRPGDRPPGVGDWELVELLGMGGFGEVWKARSPYLAEPVALKFCLDPQAARLLRNEAALLARVMSQGRHPGIVALLDTYLNGDPPCLKYEYVPGGDLAALVRERHRINPDAMIEHAPRLLADLARTAGHFHRLDPPLVHRDLKPANILVQVVWKDEVALRVADFGIGGVVAQQALGRTWTGHTAALSVALRGACTPLYASPQQQRGEPPDPRDDIYALGVIWYQMLTGDLSAAPLGDWQDDLTQRGVPLPALKLLASCVSAKAERRPRDAAALAEELAALSRLSVAAAESAGCKPANSATVAVAVEVKASPELAPPSAPTEEDLAAQVQRILGRVKETHHEARRLAKRKHDYASAARLLAGVPQKLRDEALYAKVCWRRDRVAELDGAVRAAIGAGCLAGLRPEVEELLSLTPEREDLRRLLDLLPETAPLPSRVTNSIGMELVLIGPGKFFMGSPEDEEGRGNDEWRHEVEITLPFYLGTVPVTQDQYRQVASKGPSHFSRTGAGKQRVAGLETGRFPVENLSWYDVVEFCRLLSALPGEMDARRVYRLPTEAEWEFACRAGTSSPFSFGTSASSARANFDGTFPYGGASRCLDLQRAERVARYAANTWGLYDMHGNVGEWCADWYGKDYYRHSPRRNPQGPDEGTGRVVRGGSWVASGRGCRSAQRVSSVPWSRYNFVGFRVAVSVAPRPD
jgi:formylglycine-generating enzyme required for sulfatase activity/serine/threonine protein kinase